MREQTSPSFRVVQLMTFPWRGLHCLRVCVVCVCPVLFVLFARSPLINQYYSQLSSVVSQQGPGLKLLL